MCTQTGKGFSEYRQAFSENDIDGAVLVNLTKEDLIEMGITSVGKRKSILSQVCEKVGGRDGRTDRDRPTDRRTDGWTETHRDRDSRVCM